MGIYMGEKQESKWRQVHRGRYAIQHRGIIVAPPRIVPGRRNVTRQPFDTFHEAKAWAEGNYKGDDGWRVIKL